MSPPRFFIPERIDRGLVGERIALPDAVVHHATRVLRMTDGDAITLFDGEGGEFGARLEHVCRTAAHARLETHQAIERETAFQAILVQSVIHADAMDFAIRKSVELGVAAIAPVFAARSQAQSAERARQRQTHWQGIAIAACEQCGRNRVPEVAMPVALAAWWEAADEREVVLLAQDASAHLAVLVERRKPSIVIVGPEGGFTDVEVGLARARGAALAHLGKSMLRSETAGPAALATLAAVDALASVPAAIR